MLQSKLYLFVFLILFTAYPLGPLLAQSIGINTSGSTPHRTAILDVTSTNKGILIPRMTKTERLSIPAPATGLMVYDVSANKFAYYDGTDWTLLYPGLGKEIIDTDKDTGIEVEQNNDEDKIRLRVRSTEALTINSDANVGLGVSAPSEKLEVDGAVRLGDASNSPEAGTIRWNPVRKDFEGFTGNEWVSLSGAEKLFESWASQNSTPTGIVGDALLGQSVMVYENYAIAGAPLDENGSGIRTGAAYIYQRSGNSWTEVAKLFPSDGVLGDYFGASVAIEGDYAIVGAPNANGLAADAGAAYVFYNNGSSWTQQAKIRASDGAYQDYFGGSVDISGDYVVVGAKWDDDRGSSSGSAYVFKRNGTTWSQDEKLLSQGTSPDHLFGLSVSIDGDNILIGAPGSGTILKGTSYLFHRAGNTYTLGPAFGPSDRAGGDKFGFSVDIQGDYLIIGAYQHDALGNNAGAAYVYRRAAGEISSLMGSDWFFQSKLHPSDGDADDKFGISVSINRDYAIVGGSGADISGVNSGLSYIFHRNGSTWTEQTPLLFTGIASVDLFGASVSIFGDHAVVGAPYNDVNGTLNKGSIHFFKTE